MTLANGTDFRVLVILSEAKNLFASRINLAKDLLKDSSGFALRITILVGVFSLVFANIGHASEVLPEKTNTQVLVRQHPRTGKPFVSITSNANAENPFLKNYKIMKRPDYRMLDPKVKPKEVGYDGPSSDRKKVYILAASLATMGAVGGTAIIATAPAATGLGASGGAGAYAAAGGALATGTISSAVISTRPPDPEKQNYEHRSESHAVNETLSNPSKSH